LFSLIYINILVPIGVVYSTSVNCFSYTFTRIPQVSEAFESSYNQQNCGLLLGSDDLLHFECSFNLITFETTSKITPNWIYSYSCVSSLFITYIPALLSKYTISGVVMPLFQSFLLSFHRTSSVRNNFIVKKILPLTFNNMPEDTIFDKEERQHRTYQHLSILAVDILMLFTFGIASGFLTYLIIFSMITNELMRHLQFGSYLQDRYEAGYKDRGYLFFTIGRSLFIDEIRFKFIKLVWGILFWTILLFWSLFMFDVIADVYSDEGGFIGVFVFWVYMYVSFYSIDRMKKIATTGKEIVKSINESVHNISFIKSSKSFIMGSSTVLLSSTDLKESENSVNGVNIDVGVEREL